MIKTIAYIWAYNEEDFIAHTIGHLLEQGINVHIFDNWSTDNTFNVAARFADRIKLERWPASEEQCSSLTSRLVYLEQLALVSEYDWIINHDVDEIRRTGTTEQLIEFIVRMDAAGYNAIDHRVQLFKPRERWDGSQNPEEWFTEEYKGEHTDKLNPHIKAWKRQATRVTLANTGGHQAIFTGRRIAPEKLILKHYPLRTAEQAERKIAERRQSYAHFELRARWHTQYDHKWW